MEQFAITLSYVSLISVLIPIITYVAFPNYLKGGSVISGLILASLVADIANECYTQAGQNGFLIINSFFTIQFLLLNRFYHYLMNNKVFIKLIVIAYAFLVILNSLFYQSFNEFQHLLRVYECIVLIVYASISYYNLFKNPSADKRFNLFVLWINMGVLFYFFFNLYLFGISNYILKQMFRDDAMIIWGSHSFNNVVKNVLFAIGLYEAGKNKA